jgi:hypothetical protein
VQLTVRQYIFVPSLDRVVDCADETEECLIGAAEFSDLQGTVVNRAIRS